MLLKKRKTKLVFGMSVVLVNTISCMKKIFLTVLCSCLVFTACMNKNIDRDGHPLIFCKCQELPFEKNQIQEIALHYWVRVREPGNYDNIYDSGIRHRVFVIRDKKRVCNLLYRLSVANLENISRSLNINVVFKAKNDLWTGEILSDKEMQIASKCFVLADSDFVLFCRALCGFSEQSFRSMTLDKPVYVDPKWIAFCREEAQKLKMLEYNSRCDGVSENDVRKYEEYFYGE